MASKNVRFPKENRAEKAWIIASPIFCAFRRGEMQKKKGILIFGVSLRRNAQKKRGQMCPQIFSGKRMCVSLRRNATDKKTQSVDNLGSNFFCVSLRRNAQKHSGCAFRFDEMRKMHMCVMQFSVLTRRNPRFLPTCLSSFRSDTQSCSKN